MIGKLTETACFCHALPLLGIRMHVGRMTYRLAKFGEKTYLFLDCAGLGRIPQVGLAAIKFDGGERERSQGLGQGRSRGLGSQ